MLSGFCGRLLGCRRRATGVDAGPETWRHAFWNDSWKVRPMAMASPTLFIWVVSSALAPGNFSNAKRGICRWQLCLCLKPCHLPHGTCHDTYTAWQP